MRTDGPFIEAGENDNLIVQRLTRTRRLRHLRLLVPVREPGPAARQPIGGVAPTLEKIAEGEYAVSRPLFIYVKNDHRGVIPEPRNSSRST